MNNLPQKNVIYDTEIKSVLPYKNENDVTTNSQNFRSNTINNIFCQLVDNDRFIENRILVSGKNMDGPSRYTDDQLDGLPNGTKILSSSASTEQLLILRKENKGIRDSMEKVLGGKINVLCKNGSYLLVGASFGLFKTQDGISYEKTYLSDETQITGNVTCIKVYPGIVFFGMDGDVYVSSTDDMGNKFTFKVNSNEVGQKINDICYLPMTGALYVATDQGMLRTTIRNIQLLTEEILIFSSVCQLDRDGFIDPFENYSIVPLYDENHAYERDLIAATKNGILSFDTITDGLVHCSKVLNGETCYFADRIQEDSIVVGTYSGLMDGIGNMLIDTETPVAAFCEIDEKRYYFVDSKVIRADFLIDDNGMVAVETEEFPFDKSSGDYALGMFKVNQEGWANLILIHTRGGQLLSFLPETGTFTTILRKDVERAGQSKLGSIYLVQNQEMYKYDVQGTGVQRADDISSVAMLSVIDEDGITLPLGETLKVIPDEGKSVVLTKKSVVEIDKDGIGKYMIRRFDDGDYTGIVKLNTPIKFYYYPILSDFIFDQLTWERIQDDVYELEYDYAAVRGSDNKIFVDLVNGPKKQNIPMLTGFSVLTLSTYISQNTDFQYPIDIKQDKDFLYVLATDGVHYQKNSDIEGFIQDQTSSDILNKHFFVNKIRQMEDWPLLDSNSNNRIAKTGEEVFILSSGNVVRAGFETFYKECSPNSNWNRNLKSIIPIGELSQFYMVVQNEVTVGEDEQQEVVLSDQVCCVYLTCDTEYQNFGYEKKLIFPIEGSPRVSDFGDFVYNEEDKTILLFGGMDVILSINTQTKEGITNDNTRTHYLDTLSGVYIEELSTRYEGEGEEQYQEDYVTKAIKYELKSSLVSFDVKFTRLSTEPCPVSSFVFENQASATSSKTTTEISSYDNLNRISSLNSFNFPNGFVKANKISSMYFPTDRYVDGTYIYGTFDDGGNTYVSGAINYGVKTSKFTNNIEISFISALYKTDEDNRIKFADFDFANSSQQEKITSSVLVEYEETNFDLDPEQFVLSDWIVKKYEADQDKFTRNQNGLEIYTVSTDIHPVVQEVEEFRDSSIQMFKDYTVIADNSTNKDMYELFYDESGPKVNFLETIVQWRQKPIVNIITLGQFNAVSSITTESIEQEGETVEISTFNTTNMFYGFFGSCEDNNTIFIDGDGGIVIRDQDYFVINKTGISGIGHMIDDGGRIYMTSSDVELSTCTVYRYDGSGTRLVKVEKLEFIPDQIFRDGQKIYATLSGSLFKRGEDGDDHEILESGFVQRVNHVQTVGDTTMVATDCGIAIPSYIMHQGISIEYKEIGTTTLSSVDEIAVLEGEQVKITGTRNNEDKKRLVKLDQGSGVFVTDVIFETSSFSNIVHLKGTNDILFTDGQIRLSVFDGQEKREYPFGGNALSVIAANESNGRMYVCTRNGLYFSDGFGTQDAFTTRWATQFYDISSCGRFLHVEDRSVIIPTNSGLYSLQSDGVNIDMYKTTYSITGNASFVQQTNGGFMAGVGGTVLSSEQNMQFSDFFELNRNVNDAYCKNETEYYVATDDGLYRTSYSYRLVNDTYVFSEDELYDIFMDQFQQIKDEMSSLIDQHVEEQHSENSFITRMNVELLSSDFTGVDLRDWSFQHFYNTSAEQVVDNDVVYDMEFGTNVNGEIHVQISNFLTSDSNPIFSYIRKHWYSGINELYIYLPTTHTYYISHADGSTDCYVNDDEKIFRKNLVQFGEDVSTIDSSIRNHSTSITVTVPDTMAQRMDCIFDVHINGNSLPLKIYRDEQYSFKEGDASKMFHSAILPSEVTYVPRNVDDRDSDGQYRFGFACFGQDAQAIRIMYYDSDSHVDENSFTIKYNGNGAVGSMQEQVMRFAPNAGKHLRKCTFYWNTAQSVKIFLGWSFNPKASQPDLNDGQFFEWRDYQDKMRTPKAGSSIELFAVWVDYNGEDGYTELIMDMDQNNDEED